MQSQEVLAALVGRAPLFVRAIEALPAVAKSDATVLVTGDTGTGKELVARALHYVSDRADRPLVTLNCGSLPDTLLEEELFGHERGAFTGAHADRRGLVAAADSGTLFLDEVEAMPAKAQTSLLRVLQERRYRAIGSNEERSVDVRIIAATNESLESLVASGRFRKDLYYRLCVFEVRLPALRDRPGDVALLAEHFLAKHAPRRSMRWSQAATEALEALDWPGNVRELENAVIRAVALCPGDTIDPSHLFPGSGERSRSADLEPFNLAKQRVIEAFERQYLRRLIELSEGNVTRAAKSAGKERRDLGKLLKKHGLDPQGFR